MRRNESTVTNCRADTFPRNTSIESESVSLRDGMPAWFLIQSELRPALAGITQTGYRYYYPIPSQYAANELRPIAIINSLSKCSLHTRPDLCQGGWGQSWASGLGCLAWTKHNPTFPQSISTSQNQDERERAFQQKKSPTLYSMSSVWLHHKVSGCGWCVPPGPRYLHGPMVTIYSHPGDWCPSQHFHHPPHLTPCHYTPHPQHWGHNWNTTIYTSLKINTFYILAVNNVNVVTVKHILQSWEHKSLKCVYKSDPNVGGATSARRIFWGNYLSRQGRILWMFVGRGEWCSYDGFPKQEHIKLSKFPNNQNDTQLKVQ